MIRVLEVGRDSTEGPDADGPVVIELEMGQRYHHTMGASSPFFAGLERQMLLATACDTCGATYFPPRPHCRQDLGTTSWYELPGTGSVQAATMVHSPPPFGGIEAPYVLASIRLDGVDGGLTHRMLGATVPVAGTPVTAHYPDGPHAHPLLAVAFVAEDIGG